MRIKVQNSKICGMQEHSLSHVMRPTYPNSKARQRHENYRAKSLMYMNQTSSTKLNATTY